MTPDFTKLYKRWSTGTPRKEESMEETFILIDKDGLLKTNQKNTLYENAALNFELGKYKSLADILYQEGVKVQICKGIPERLEKLPNDYLKEFEEYWQGKLQSNNVSERAKAERAIGDIKKERKYIENTKLRGCYFPKRKIIELYPEEMATEYAGKRMTELLVSTLAHEVMHAYFDRKGHSHYPYAYFVEEPLAEFGMLLYLQETGLFKILAWATTDVANKQSCYHYGAVLYDQYMNWNPFLRRYLEEYKYNINKYEILDVASGETAVGLPCPISVEPCGVATATTTSSHCSAPTASHTGVPSSYRIRGNVYTLMFEKSNVNDKKMIFDPKQGFWTVPAPVVKRYSSLFSSLHGNKLELNIVNCSFSSSLAQGEATIEHWTSGTYAIRLDKYLRPIFQSTFKHLKPKGILLEVAFYKNVSNNHDWVLMVK